MTRHQFTPTRARHVAIVGSRHITDYRTFAATIRPLLRPSDVIVSGGADGVDTLAARFARQNGHQHIEHLPDQQLVKQKMSEGMDRNAAYGFAAHARNSLIVRDSDVMIAIACDHAKGTYDSLRKMRTKLGIESYRTADARVLTYLWECSR